MAITCLFKPIIHKNAHAYIRNLGSDYNSPCTTLSFPLLVQLLAGWSPRSANAFAIACLAAANCSFRSCPTYRRSHHGFNAR